MKMAWSIVRIFCLFSCSVAVSAQGLTEAPRIKIGVMVCLSGACAEWGTNSRRGVELAVEELNRVGGLLGRRVQAVFEDSRDDTPSNTVSAFRKLMLDPEIKLIVGPTWTIGAMAVAPLIRERKDLVVVSPSVGVGEFNESAEHIFNTWPADEKATRALARYAISRGWRKAAIFGSQEPWVEVQSNTFDDEFRKLGGTITARVEPLPNSRELSAEVLRIKSANPQVVFFSNYQADVMAKELKRLHSPAAQLAILMEQDRIKAAQGALDGTIFAQYDKPAESFVRAFVEKFQQQPGITADTSYDAIFLLAKVIHETQSLERDKLVRALHRIRGFQGASGTFSINPQGAVDKHPVLWKVQGLEYLRVESVEESK